MCLGCMSNAEFVVASGGLSVSGLRVGLRAMLPVTPAFLRKVSDAEAAAFLATYAEPGMAPTEASVDSGADAFGSRVVRREARTFITCSAPTAPAT